MIFFSLDMAYILCHQTFLYPECGKDGLDFYRLPPNFYVRYGFVHILCGLFVCAFTCKGECTCATVCVWKSKDNVQEPLPSTM